MTRLIKTVAAVALVTAAMGASAAEPQLYMAGDSIMNEYKSDMFPQYGWGLAANETKVDFGDWAVRLHARNDGVAWRFETEFGDKPMLVMAESTNIIFPKGAELCYTVAPGFMSGWEKPAVIGPVESVPAGHPQIVMTPFTMTVQGSGVVTVTESDLRDYPGINFYRREGETDTLRSRQANCSRSNLRPAAD